MQNTPSAKGRSQICSRQYKNYLPARNNSRTTEELRQEGLTNGSSIQKVDLVGPSCPGQYPRGFLGYNDQLTEVGAWGYKGKGLGRRVPMGLNGTPPSWIDTAEDGEHARQCLAGCPRPPFVRDVRDLASKSLEREGGNMQDASLYDDPGMRGEETHWTISPIAHRRDIQGSMTFPSLNPEVLTGLQETERDQQHCGYVPRRDGQRDDRFLLPSLKLRARYFVCSSAGNRLIRSCGKCLTHGKGLPRTSYEVLARG